jgi:hypothetical protein
MPYTDGLPFAADSHESFIAAQRASLTRATKTVAYLLLLYRRGPLTDPEVAAEMRWPRSSVCSIRGGVMAALLVERTGITRASEYGAQCRAWYLSPAGIAAVKAMQQVA